MLVTIFADASFDHQTKAGSWAGWAKSKRGSTKHSALFFIEFVDSLQAEMAAIVNAIHIARRAGVALSGDDLLIQTDCQAAIKMLEKPLAQLSVKRKHHLRYGDQCKAFKEKTLGHKVTFRHVKGHSKTQDARSEINRQCDRAARRLRRQEGNRRRAEKEGAAA